MLDHARQPTGFDTTTISQVLDRDVIRTHGGSVYRRALYRMAERFGIDLKEQAGCAASVRLDGMTVRRDLVRTLSAEARSVSSIARELGLGRREVEEHLRHAIRSAAAAGHRIVIEPARCRQCGFVFGSERLLKPGKCPDCHGTRLYEAQIRIE